MPAVASPTHDPDHLDRAIDCHRASGPAFQALAEQIQALGWSNDEAAVALLGRATGYFDGCVVQIEVESALLRAAESSEKV